MFSAEDIERQIAVVIVVAVEKLALLISMEGYVGRIEIQDYIPRGSLKALEENLTEKIFNLPFIPVDLAVAIPLNLIVFFTQFQTIKGTLTGG